MTWTSDPPASTSQELRWHVQYVCVLGIEPMASCTVREHFNIWATPHSCILFFKSRIIFHVVYILFFLYPLISWCSLRLLKTVLQWTWEMSFQYTDLISLGSIPGGGTAGSDDSSIFYLLGNFYTISLRHCPNWYSYRQCAQVPFSMSPAFGYLYLDACLRPGLAVLP